MNDNEPKPAQDPNLSSNQPKEEKVSDKIKRIRDAKKVDEIYDYAKHNKEQAATYVLIVLGLLILFFSPLVGGLIIGMVAGYYFAPEIVSYIRNLNQLIRGPDHLRYVALTALLIGLLIATPGIFIGAAVVAAFKQILSE